jgi:hypothetical protein
MPPVLIDVASMVSVTGGLLQKLTGNGASQLRCTWKGAAAPSLYLHCVGLYRWEKRFEVLLPSKGILTMGMTCA